MAQMENLSLLVTNLEQVLTVVFIGYYLAQCFAGYRILKICIAVSCFITGFLVVFSLTLPHFDQAYAPAVFGLLVGVFLAFVGYKLYLVGVFVLCGSLAAIAISWIPFPDSNPWTVIAIILGIVAFIVVGVLGVKFSKACIILVTAITGSLNAINFMKGPLPELNKNVVLSVVLIIVLAILGIVVQKLTTRNME